MVQLPEACDEKSEAFKAGYLTIAEIGKERIRRVSFTTSDGHVQIDLSRVQVEGQDVYYSVELEALPALLLSIQSSSFSSSLPPHFPRSTRRKSSVRFGTGTVAWCFPFSTAACRRPAATRPRRLSSSWCRPHCPTRRPSTKSSA
jgi:hypothetical protein